jgi:hypothetical protein
VIGGEFDLMFVEGNTYYLTGGLHLILFAGPKEDVCPCTLSALRHMGSQGKVVAKLGRIDEG